MSSRESILQAIKQNTQKKYPVPDYSDLEKKAVTYENKLEQFSNILAAVGGKAIELQEGEDINEVIKALFPEAKRIASNLKEVTTSTGKVLPITCATFHPDDVAASKDLNGTDVAIIQGHLGVCENAAVWVDQDFEQRTVYFITEALVMVLDKTKLVNNMHEAYKQTNVGDLGYGVFISGPSKTADIEQALVMGAHGARTAIVFLV